MTDHEKKDESHPVHEGRALARRRRNRSIAIAVALAGFALIFYVLTIAKMGPALFERAL